MKTLIIGDVHGCFDALMLLLDRAQAHIKEEFNVVFLGDLLDRGSVVEHIDLFKWMVATNPISVMGNHEWKIVRWLWGNKVNLHGTQQPTIDAINALPELRDGIRIYLQSLPYFLVLTDPNQKTAVLCHAGCLPKHIWDYPKASDSYKKTIHARMIYGETDGTKTHDGYPNRIDEADHWVNSGMLLIHGHVVMKEPIWRGPDKNVISIDQGCVFGGKLTGLIYPELELIQVSHEEVYNLNTGL